MATVRYIVDDVAAAIAFYVDQLGFTLKQQFGPAMAIVRRGDLELWLAGPAASASRAMPDGRKPAPGGWNRFVLEVGNLDEIVGRLRTAGVAFRNDIVRGPGGSQIVIDDPAGNAIELFQANRT